MSETAILEERLEVVEGVVADLQRRLGETRRDDNWLVKIAGSISDDAAFLAALEFGRAIRQVDRPADDSGEQP